VSKQRSLRRRLVRTYVALIAVVLILVLAWAGLVLQRSRVEHRQQELEVEASFMASVLGEHLVDETHNESTLSYLQNVAASLQAKESRRLVIVDERGYVLADSRGELLPLTPVGSADLAATLGSEALYATAPIHWEDRELGSIYLAMPESELYARVYRQWLLLGVPGLLVALATGAVSLWLASRILEPVQALTKAAREMAAGALDRRIAVDTADELGAMGRAFNQMADRVTDMLAQQRAFVANASHELRTPLTSIKLWIEALLSGTKDDPEEAARFLNEIAQQTERLSHMVEQLLNLSRLESGLVSTERIPTALPGFIRGIVAELAPQFEHKNHAVQVDILASLPKVPFDPDQIRRALINLLDNALKYTPPGGQIRIVADWHTSNEQQVDGPATARPAWVRISVSDSGSGIAEKDLPHVFERFYRSAEARSGGEKGAGLGLAIVRCIIETHHGGRVWAESDGVPGQGTTIRFVLPLELPSNQDGLPA
jgi:signal transduction histidine kinase